MVGVGPEISVVAVSVKTTFTPGTFAEDASTVTLPAVTPSISVAEANPCALVVTWLGVEKEPAPDVTAKSIGMPATGTPRNPEALTTSGLAKVVPTKPV